MIRDSWNHKWEHDGRYGYWTACLKNDPSEIVTAATEALLFEKLRGMGYR